MSDFTLELITDAGIDARPLNLKQAADAWRHIEAVARQLPDPARVRIRVRDSNGGIVVLANAAAALTGAATA